jgi:predicted enzyme related to lactoylglutathione lyase
MAHGDITHIEIPVSDNARATDFYRSLFGWDIAEYPGYEGYPMWQAPNKISGGGLTARNERTTVPVSYVEVDSIDETLAKVTAAGGEVVNGKTPISETSWSASFRDLDGNEIGIYEGTTSGSGA